MKRRDLQIPKGALKIELPRIAQTTGHTCGPAALLAVGAYWGVLGDLEWEHELAAAMGVGRAGADPHQITVPARARLGLEVQEHQPMTDAALRRALDLRRPVILMMQAWGEGHWVVAIGYDRARVYFEDPVLHASRGYLGWRELDSRWHDVGFDGRRVRRYGVSLWRPGRRPPERARWIAP